MQTIDGIEVVKGMPIFVFPDDNGDISKFIVGNIEGSKIFYADPDPDGKIGCHCRGAYSTLEAAQKARDDSKITPELDLDSARLVRIALAEKLGETLRILSILRIANERELTETERFMLHGNLRYLHRSELIEQIDPWVSLQITYELLIEKFVKKGD
jgi:hypothetical protein